MAAAGGALARIRVRPGQPSCPNGQEPERDEPRPGDALAERAAPGPGAGPDQRGECIQGSFRSRNSGSPTLSLPSSSICAASSGGTSLRSPSRAAASEVK